MIAPNTMIRPCMVVSWLKNSGRTICRPGSNSSARIISAITPPDEEHGEREHQVQRADILVVGGVQPATPAMRRAVGMVAVNVLVARDYIVSNARHDNLLKRILRC